MINFWSYKDEYKNNRTKLLNLIDKSIKSGQIFFGKNLSVFENNFKKMFEFKKLKSAN